MKGWHCLVVVVAIFCVGVGATHDDPHIAIDEPKSQNEKMYMQWLRTAGVKLYNVDVANFTNPIYHNFKVRGVKATADIEAGQELLTVPADMIMSTMNALKSPLGVVFSENAHLFKDDQVLLSVFVLNEVINANTSKWSAMISVLPTRFHSVAEYSGDELRLLEGTQLYDEAIAKQQLFDAEFHSLFPLLCEKYPFYFDCALVTPVLYKYARLLVQTRAFGIHIQGKTLLGIVPFGDMFNHDVRAQISWKFDSTTKTFRMYAGQPYAKGTQVYNNYGPRSNRKLLLDFGFVVPDNPYDFVEFPAPVVASSSPDRLRILKERSLEGRQSFAVGLGQVPPDLLFMARIALASPDELLAYRRSLELIPQSQRAAGIPAFNASISLANEARALRWLESVANVMLAKYRTTYEEDLVQLDAADNLPRATFNALLLHAMEKRIFKFLTHFAEVHLPLLDFFASYATTNAMTNARLHYAGAEYMRNVLLPLQRTALTEAQKSPS